MNIIVIDDEPKVRKGLTNILRSRYKRNIAIVSFPNGIDALHFLKENPADIIITDIKMPKMNGLEMIEKLRKENFEVEFIILSGYSYFEYAQKAIELKVRKYLTKPTNTKELFKTIDEIKLELDEKIEDEYEEKADEGQPSNLIVLKSIEFIENNYNRKLSLKQISEELYVSPNYLSRLFKKEMGVNLFDYIQMFRLEKSKELLDDLSFKVFEIAKLVGYSDNKYFGNLFKKTFDCTPLEYRNRGNRKFNSDRM